MPKYFQARYPGLCNWCTTKFKAGEEICENPATHGMSEKRYVHKRCMEAHLAKNKAKDDKQGKLF